MKHYTRKDCRLCSSKNLSSILNLTPTPWADDYRKKENINKKQETIPLDILMCNDCNHGQLSHVIDAKEVYLNYTYETASTLGLGEHFKKTADTIIKNFKPHKNGLVVDIGSNDGILLKYFQDYGMKILGVDPMPGIAEKATKNGIPTISNFFSEAFSKEMKKKYGSATVISSNNLVADTDDLNEFIKGVKNLMDKDSIFFFETFYFYLQVKNFVWDFTYHEHYSYFNVEPLIKYFKKFDMEIIDVEPNLTKGGSMRCTLQLKGGKRKINPSVQKFVNEERAFGFPNKKLFKDYSQKIQRSKAVFLEEINKLLKAGKKISGYGASATSTTLIYHYEMGKLLNVLYDDFTVKQGLFSPGYNIEVFPSNKIYEHRPDYVVILAWRYKDKIIQKNKKFLDNGGHFIIPLPEFKII